MSHFEPPEKGVTQRLPSTANLLIDSRKTTLGNSTPANINIQRSQSILNGFFTRIATTEVVFEWNQPNVSAALGSNTFQVLLGGPGAPAVQNLVLPDNFYNVEQALKSMVAIANANGAISALGTFSVTGANGIAGITFSNAANSFLFTGGVIPTRLGIAATTTAAGGTLIVTNGGVLPPDLRIYRYLDFVSPQLTYNQALKDGSDFVERNVLCRWYMAWDQQPVLDAFGFPIQMGYTPFQARRLFNPPKQIRWENNMPIGNLTFQIYPDFGLNIATLNDATNWLMTLQVSEV
jgi:hypothetical protein